MLLNLALCYKERQTASSRMDEKKHKNIKKGTRILEKELIAKYMRWTECMSIQIESSGFQLT